MTAEEMIEALKGLPTEERRRVAKHLALELSRPDGEDAPAELAVLFGTLRDDPLQRPPQGTFEVRDELR
jgi:hypothetical protein